MSTSITILMVICYVSATLDVFTKALPESSTSEGQESKITDEAAAREWLKRYEENATKISYDTAQAEWNYNVNITEHNERKQVEQSLIKSQFIKEAYASAVRFDWQNFRDLDLKRQFKKVVNIGYSVLPDTDISRADTLRSTMMRVYSVAEVCRKNKNNNIHKSNSQNNNNDKTNSNSSRNNSESDSEVNENAKEEETAIISIEDDALKSTQESSENDNCHQLEPDLTRIMASSRDWDELVWAWKGWRDATGRLMKENYSEFVSLMNRAAHLTDYKDLGEFWRAAYEMDDFGEECERLWLQVKPLYQQLHAYVKRKLMEKYPDHADQFPSTGHLPAHLTGNMWAQKWSNIFDLVVPYPGKDDMGVTEALVEQGYNATGMFNLADNFFQSLGLEPMPPEFWKNSMLEKPTDGRHVICHASAWDFANRKDFRIKQCTDVTGDYLATTHHEMGHVQYYIQYRHQPLVYRKGANPGFHEAVGDVMALSVNTPEHLEKIKLVKTASLRTHEADINFLLKQALEKVSFLPFGYLIDKWRWKIFDGSTTRESYNSEWWKLRCSLQGLSSPVVRTEQDFDPAAKFHVPNNTPYIRYFVSYIIQFQFHKALCEAAGHQGPSHRCDIYESREAGTKLKQMLSMGSSKPWPDAMQNITGQRYMDASALLDYFQPLHDWLKQQNEGHDVTWTDECPPGTLPSPVGYTLDGSRARPSWLLSALIVMAFSMMSVCRLAIIQ